MKKVPVKLLLNPVHFLSLGFGTGLVPVAPGTAGTLAGTGLYMLLAWMPLPSYLLLVGFLYLAGIALCAYTARTLETRDHPAIVWDEVVGFLVTMSFAPEGWQWILAGFLLFRVFDIWKPWPIRRLERQLKGGHGIMADDLLAAVFALTILQIIAYIL